MNENVSVKSRIIDCTLESLFCLVCRSFSILFSFSISDFESDDVVEVGKDTAQWPGPWV